MNNKEALQALLDGKKVKQSGWEKDSYLCFKNDVIMDEGGEHLATFFDNLNNWEIHEDKCEINRELLREIYIAASNVRLKVDGFTKEHIDFIVNELEDYIA